MRYGILTSRGSVVDIVEKAREAERQGFDFFGVGDTQAIFRELYVVLGLVAEATDHIEVGPTVTNPVTRHPAVTASAMCTAAEVAGGRTYLGLGSGDSAVRTLGKPPATLAEMEAFIDAFRPLCAGEAVEWEGEDIALTWLQRDDQRHDIPVVLSAAGPRTLELAGRVADRVYVASGITQPVVEDAVERVRKGATAADRDPEDVEVLVWAKSNIAATRAAAIEELQVQLANAANHGLAFSLEAKQVPEKYHEPIRQLQEAYVPHQHLGLERENPNRKLVDEFGLTEYLADRFTVTGTPEQCIEKLETVTAIDGVDGVLFTADTTDQLGHITRLGEEVLPSL